jgi:uncharacterized protein (TIGR03437 family)
VLGFNYFYPEYYYDAPVTDPPTDIEAFGLFVDPPAVEPGMLSFNPFRNTVAFPQIQAVNQAGAPPGWLTPGQITTAAGLNLAGFTMTAAQPYPQLLADVIVTVNGQQAQIESVSPTQVTFLMPDGAQSGPAPVVVSAGLNDSAPFSAQVPTYGAIAATPSSLVFSGTYGGGPTPAQTVNMTASGGTVNFVAAGGPSWLRPQPGYGATPQQVNVTASLGGLVPGSYSGVLTFNSGTFTSSVNITLNVSESGGFSPCDVNRDGAIDVRDVQELIDQALGALAPTSNLTGSGVANVAGVQIGINAVLDFGCAAQ